MAPENKPETRRADNGTDYQLAPGQDPTASVVTLIGARGEPGLAIKRKEWESWKTVAAPETE